MTGTITLTKHAPVTSPRIFRRNPESVRVECVECAIVEYGAAAVDAIAAHLARFPYHTIRVEE
jgi:hypothetical protein